MSETCRKTILLVEDEPIVSITQKMFLERYGYNVVTAASGEKALSVFSENNGIDLVLMDIDLGEGLNGPDTARLMLQVKTVPIVFLSSHTEPEIVETTEKITSYGYVVKDSGITVLDASIKMAFRLFNANCDLRDRENEYNDLYNNAPCGYHTLGPDGVFMSVNDTELKWTGYSREELVGKMKMTDLLTPEAREVFNKGFISVMKAGNISNFENSIVRKDGSVMHVLVTANAVYDENGGFVMSRGTITDITGRVEAEAADRERNKELEATNEELNAVMEEMEATNEELLAANEMLHQRENELCASREKYRVIFENRHYAVCIFDYETREFLDVNRAFTEIYGYSREEVLSGMKHGEITAQFEESDESILRTAAGGSTYIPVRYHRKKDGTVFPVEIVGEQFDWMGRRVMFGMTNDITDRISLEKSIRESEGKYRVIFDMSIYGICIYDIETLIMLDVNAALADMYGYTREEFLSGMTIMDLSAEQDDTKSAIEKVKLDRALYIPLRYHRRKDGEVFPIEIVGGVYSLAGRDVIFGIFNDITERKKAEDDIKTLLGEKELILREVHHRIKNNMGTIYGLLMLQADSLKNKTASRALTDAANRVKSMVVLYDKLYRVTDFQEISPGDYFSMLTDEIIASFQPGDMVKVEKDIDDFTVDVKLLQPMGIIINELLTNVMKHAFADGEGGIVRVTAKSGPDEFNFSVADNGKGLPEGTDCGCSSGFGMQLVAMLAEQIGAEICINRGDWTEFIVSLKSR